MGSTLQKYRAADPHLHNQNGATPSQISALSGLLSLNIFYQHKIPSLCMSNCRSIEVSILYPLNPEEDSTSISESSNFSNFSNSSVRENSQSQPTGTPAEMRADQEQAVDLSLTTTTTSRETTSSPCSETPTEEIFRFLDLPLELRLKIYAYLLPSRTHTIVTQIPHNGYFYNTTTVPLHSAQSFYPFGRSPPKTGNLTTYRILNTNFRAEFPAPGIFPQILRVSKQALEEAEPVLYGSNGTVFDFGIYLEAVSAFFGDRSEVARRSVRNVRIAREIPAVENREGDEADSKGVDARWVALCGFLKEEMTGLRNLDLTMWSSSGSLASFPSLVDALNVMVDEEKEEEAATALKKLVVQRWREWEWTYDILQLEALRRAKITWWGFQTFQGSEGEHSFDSWLAGRMVGDRFVRDRMVKEGVVVEGFVVLPGAGT